MTELSFLVELLLNHHLRKETKALIAKRIEEVSAHVPQTPVRGGVVQAPSTQRALAKDPTDVETPEPPVSHSSVTAQALADRDKAIRDAMSRKMDRDAGAPPKFRGGR